MNHVNERNYDYFHRGNDEGSDRPFLPLPREKKRRKLSVFLFIRTKEKCSDTLSQAGFSVRLVGMRGDSRAAEHSSCSL